MDTQQANRLVAQYSNMILRISYQYLKQTYDAEDICQTVFLKYLTKAPQFENEQHEKAWIIRTTVNACKDYLKSSFFRRTVALDEAETIPAPAVPDTPILDALQSSGIAYEHYSEVEANPSVETVEAIYSLYHSTGCNGFLAIGGGSAMDAT